MSREIKLDEYLALSKAKLTVADVRDDAEYMRKRGPVKASYMGIDAPVFRAMKRAKPEDKAALFDALADYFLTGQEPDYEALEAVSPMAATLTDVCITAHEARFESEIVKHYKQFCAGKATQAKAAGLTISELPDESF